MPKKKPGMTPEEQSAEFKRLASELEAAGELNPIDAERRLDQIVRKSANQKPDSDQR